MKITIIIVTIALSLLVGFYVLLVTSLFSHQYKPFARNQFTTVQVDSSYVWDTRYSFEIKNPYITKPFDTVLVLSKKSGYVLFYNISSGKVKSEELWYFKAKTNKLNK